MLVAGLEDEVGAVNGTPARKLHVQGSLIGGADRTQAG